MRVNKLGLINFFLFSSHEHYYQYNLKLSFFLTVVQSTKAIVRAGLSRGVSVEGEIMTIETSMDP